MAIYTGTMRQHSLQKKEAERLAKETAKQEAKAKKRKGWSGLLGKAAGALIGAGAVGLTGLTGGLAGPLVLAAGQFAGRKLAHEATKGMAADTSKIKSQSKYGYGKKEAKTLREGLKQQMAVDPMKERGGFGKDLLSAYTSAGLSGGLTGAGKGLLQGDLSLGEALTTGSKDAWQWGGTEGMMQGITGLLPEGEDVVTDPETALTSEELGESAFVPSGGGAMESFDPSMTSELPGETAFTIDPNTGEMIQTNAQGGQVMNQQQLMQLLALSQMQQQEKTYDNTPLEETQPTISDYFASKGKTLGGNNMQSLSQMLGR